MSSAADELTFIAILASDTDTGSLLSSDESDATFVACFGDLEGSTSSATCAEAVRNAYESGGLGDVAALDGCFAAAIYDKQTAELLLTQDGVGQRSLRYVVCDDVAVVSPHDLPLVATGLVPVEADLTTAASITALGWSVGDASLLSHIGTCAPGQNRIILPSGAIRIEPHPYCELDRVRSDDVAGTAARREALIEAMRAAIPGADEASEMRVELSAGFDSRAVLGTAVSARGAETLSAFSDGDAKSHDVRMAATIAQRMGVRFAGGIPVDAGTAARLTYVTELAIDTNGQANALVGMTDVIPSNTATPLPSLCGDGGEIYRGYYYSKTARYTPAPPDAASLAESLLKRSRFADLPWRDRIGQTLVTRIKQRTTFIARLAAEQSDAMDLLYLLERFAVWNQKLRRNRHQRHRTSPFFSRSAIRAFLTLPAPRGKVAQVHETLVRRFAPQTLSLLVNREFHVGLLTGGRVQRMIGQGLVNYRRVVRKVTTKLSRYMPARKDEHNDLESIRARRLIELLIHPGRSLLCGEESLGTQLFGRAAIAEMVDRAIAGDRRDIRVLGALLTAELWLKQARAVRAAGQTPRRAERPVLQRVGSPA